MIRIIGPRDPRDRNAINTTSRSHHEWTSQLSPFNLGPVKLYGDHSAPNFENAWQFAKVYAQPADSAGDPTQAYWNWARRGWNATRPYRYPMGKGNRPLYSLWRGQKLGYIDARHEIYLPLYRDLVKQTPSYAILKSVYEENGEVRFSTTPTESVGTHLFSR